MLWWLSKQIWWLDAQANYLHVPERGTFIIRLSWKIPPPMAPVETGRRAARP
jgi:hypothetical protein